MADGPVVSLIQENTKIKVSSVLNRDVKEYGKKFMFDGKEETCWNSDQGSPQFIVFDFSRNVQLKEIQIQFQGGFVGCDCQIEGGDSTKSLSMFHQFYPDDVNTLQIFPVNSKNSFQVLKITFSKSTDFYGRITIYKLDLLGSLL
ncbi:nuclear receptor 2C2-associated protein-like [Actinia tenebrosa]|uniref:Nuclear receptor 2C2-associated protein n=1 Tax=Actinia tenebrosa TaxID=6105 RepID=A0A6P8I1Y3_ACTTE|nr:nuclear receptor 2C2-associated protein-like [Actinia tenebrosa]